MPEQCSFRQFNEPDPHTGIERAVTQAKCGAANVTILDFPSGLSQTYLSDPTGTLRTQSDWFSYQFDGIAKRNPVDGTIVQRQERGWIDHDQTASCTYEDGTSETILSLDYTTDAKGFTTARLQAYRNANPQVIATLNVHHKNPVLLRVVTDDGAKDLTLSEALQAPPHAPMCLHKDAGLQP